ncbi:hypothetical protein [Paraburkholderia bryophila]|uniref:hypothetical protein n=1 Tax=Paraburkholderia bryophila TaxID=420952 RepID=UPI0011BECAC0|nr:hypothetical protein [Paraburkholderia bryophila]
MQRGLACLNHHSLDALKFFRHGGEEARGMDGIAVPDSAPGSAITELVREQVIPFLKAHVIADRSLIFMQAPFAALSSVSLAILIVCFRSASVVPFQSRVFSQLYVGQRSLRKQP